MGRRPKHVRWSWAWLAGVACASTPPPPATSSSSSRGSEAAPEATAPSVDPCASPPLCVDRAEAQADVDTRSAEAALEVCLACDDASPAGYRLLADLARGRGDKGKARQVLLEGRRRFPESASLLLALGRLERDEGRTAEAMSLLRQGVRLHPRDELIAAEYEALLARYGTPKERKAAEIQPLLREAAGRYEIDDVEGARQTLRLARRRAAGFPCLEATVDHRLALVALTEGELGRADRALGTALDECSDDPLTRGDLLLTLSELRLAQQRWGEAEKAGRDALALSPADPLVWTNLALALAGLGRVEEALDAFEQAVDRGLSRRLTLDQLLALGEPVERLADKDRFRQLTRRGWPGAHDSP